MTDITLIFPDQLFLEHPCVKSDRTAYLVEEFLFFKVQPFHKQKLVLLRAAMQKYCQWLQKNKIQVIYISSKDLNKRKDAFNIIGKAQIKNIHLAEFTDDWLYQDLMTAAKKFSWNIHFHPSPGFVSSNYDLQKFFEQKKHYSMAHFYTHQRINLNILMNGTTPVGGKYSFDIENRKKIPKGIYIPPPFFPGKKTYIEKICAEIESEFPDSIGKAYPFLYPSTHEEAKLALEIFLNEKLQWFGDYQDAIQDGDSFLFHSVLSPLLNIGLLTPQQVIKATLDHAKNNNISLNSLEGFLRQIIGWREFVRATYLLKGSKQRSSNFFSHKNKIPKQFWNGTTGILPIDTIIKSILQTGYCNHIERLMVLGNFLLLTESDPNEVYTWFMGYFVDAYDWVMVSNVYGMSQYADGGTIVTKPYISSSNYILKMSNYAKGDWTEIWDGLFWRFVQKNHLLFSSNPRTQTMTSLLSKNKISIGPKIVKAEMWLKNYYHNEMNN